MKLKATMMHAILAFTLIVVSTGQHIDIRYGLRHRDSLPISAEGRDSVQRKGATKGRRRPRKLVSQRCKNYTSF
jgi:hypothetical protein